MVKAMVDISEESNRVLNIVKAKLGLKDKSQAIDFVMKEFEEEMLGAELKPEFIERIRKMEKGKTHGYTSVKDLRREIENV